MISETKIDNTFPQNQFLIVGFGTPYRLIGTLLYVREDVPSNLIAIENKPIESRV